MRGRWLVVAAIALAVPAPAAADDDDDAEVARDRDPKVALATARQAVKKGDAATRARKADDAKARYAEAIAAFEDAIAAGADVGTYVELAAIEEKAGQLDRAAIHYRTVLAAQGVRADLVKKATARYDELTTKLGLVVLAVKPAGATITLGGKVVGTTPLADPLVLMPGTYAITIAADGHQPRDIEIEVDAGSESERTIELEAAAEDTPQPTPPPPPTVARPAPQGPSTTPMLVAGGATIALLGLAAGTGVLAVGKHNQFEDPASTPQERADAKDSGKRLALITDISLAGAAIAGGIAVYWYVAKYRPAQRAHAVERAAPAGEVGAKVDLVPWVQSDAGGVTVLGSF